MKSPQATEFAIQYERIINATGATSDADLAKILGITQPSVCDTKARKSIPKAWLIKVHDMFGTSIDWMLFGDVTLPVQSRRDITLFSHDFQTAITNLFNSVAIEDDVEKLTINATPTFIEIRAIKSDGSVVKNTFTPTTHESVTTHKRNDKTDREKEARRLYTTEGLSQKEIAQRLNRSQSWVSGVVRNK